MLWFIYNFNNATVMFSTAYYALCLISKTSLGADVLLKHNWTTVCHSLAEKWPLAFQEIPSSLDAVFTSPVTSPQKVTASLRQRVPSRSQYNIPSPPTPSWAEARLPSYKPAVSYSAFSENISQDKVCGLSAMEC